MKQSTNHSSRLLIAVAIIGALIRCGYADTTPEKSVEGPNGVRVAVKTIGPVTQTTDLQILCILKHDPAGDKYIGAMKDFDDKLGGLLSSLRDRGEFIGEAGETLVFTPPANSIAPKRVLLIGVGEESTLSLDRLRPVGRIAAREAVRLNVAHVSFAPALRDQGSSRIDVGEGGGSVAEQFLLAYDTEKRLQERGLAPRIELRDFTIEAGPKYFDNVWAHVARGVASAAAQIERREALPKTR